MMTVKDYFGNPIEVLPRLGKYASTNNLAIRLVTTTGEPWSTLTVNLDIKLPPDYAYVDVNNDPGAKAFISNNKLGEWTGGVRQSGFVVYPLYKFDLDRLKKLEKESL